MPNWCNNDVLITGDKEKIDAIFNFIESKKSDESQDATKLLEFLIPNPEGEWDYRWCIDNWGTKWDVDVHYHERIDENQISLSFDSAWGPPIQAYNTLEELGYDVEAHYIEEGMCFIGQYIGGEDESYDYTDVASLDDVPEELVEHWNLRERLEEWLNEEEIEDGE